MNDTHNLREMREKAGLSCQDLRDGMLPLVPKRYLPSVSQLTRIETGQTASVDTILLMAAAQVIGCKLSDLSMEAALEMETIRDLVVSTSPCITAGQA